MTNKTLAILVVAVLVLLVATVAILKFNEPAAPRRVTVTAAAPAAPGGVATTGGTTGATSAPTTDPAMAATFARTLPELRFDQIAADDVFDFLRDITGANLYVSWRSLESIGVGRTSPISARLRDVRFDKTLTTLLESLTSGKEGKATYTVADGVIIILAADDLPAWVVNKVTLDARPVDAKMRQTLDRPLPEIRFDQIALSDVIGFLRDVSGANIFVNWRALEAAGVDRRAPITLRLGNAPLRTALWLMLDAAQTRADQPLDFTVDNEVITISSVAPATTRPAAAKTATTPTK